MSIVTDISDENSASNFGV